MTEAEREVLEAFRSQSGPGDRAAAFAASWVAQFSAPLNVPDRLEEIAFAYEAGLRAR